MLREPWQSELKFLVSASATSIWILLPFMCGVLILFFAVLYVALHFAWLCCPWL